MTHLPPYFRVDYVHNNQIEMCARHLEILRTDMGENWSKWSDGESDIGLGKSGKKTSKNPWSPEQISFAAYLIRHASESVDFQATVDFITHDTLAHIKQSMVAHSRRRIGHLKQWDLFTHEHMVPGKAALKLLTVVPRDTSLVELMSALSFRSLVTGTKRKRPKGRKNDEVGKLDAQYAARLPDPKDVPNWQGPSDLCEIPPKYYGLMRYEAVGLVEKLLPINGRAKELLDDYKKYRMP